MNQYENGWVMAKPSKEMQQQELWLLTTMGVAVKGQWAGAYGEYYVGWSSDSPYKDHEYSPSKGSSVVMVRKPTHDACTVTQ